MKENFPAPFDSNPLEALTPRSRGNWKPGRVLLNNYEVQRIIGEGGMGKVYLVYNEASDEFLAVKTLLRESLNLSKSKQLFIRELKTWIDIPLHPNITACRYFRTVRDKMAIFSEYVNGGPLSEWVDQQKLISLDQIFDVAIQIAWGIEAAHKKGIIHQDIKPPNILMTQDGIAKITDFGLARARHNIGLTNPKTIMNTPNAFLISSGGMTPAFCSPEQAEKVRISQKTDIWSYGLAILQMFTGRVTWRLGCLARDILEEYLHWGPSFPYPEMPAQVSDVLWKCFEFSPENRWNSCQEIADRLIHAYTAVTGCRYFRQPPEPLNLLRHSLADESTVYQHWVNPGKWIEKLKINLEPDWQFPRHWLSESSGSFRVKALCDLEIYEDLVGLYVDTITRGKHHLVFELAMLLIDKSGLHTIIDDISGAVNQLRKSISLQLTMKQQIRQKVNKFNLARTFYMLSSELLRKTEFHDCLKCGRTGLKLIGQIDTVEKQKLKLKILVTQAGANFYLEQYTDALMNLDEAQGIVNLLKKTVSLPQLLENIGTMLRNRSAIYRIQNKHDEALNVLTAGLELFHQIPDEEMTPDQRWAKSSIHMNLANLCSYMGLQETCLINHDKSIEIKEKLIKTMGWEFMAADLSVDLMNKAVSLIKIGHLENALELLDEATILKEEIVYYFGRIEEENNLSWVYLNKSIVLHGLKRTNEALEYITKAGSIKERLLNTRGKKEMAQQLAMVYSNKASLLKALEKYDEANEFYEKSISIRKKLVFEQNRKDLIPILADTISGKGSVLLTKGHFAEGMELFNESIDLLKPLISEENSLSARYILSMIYAQKGEAYSELPNNLEALDLFNAAGELLETIVFTENHPEYLPEVVKVWIGQIEILIEIDEYHKACQLRDCALKYLNSTWSPSVKQLAHENLYKFQTKVDELFKGISS